jgi:hypothetical protein
VGKVMIADGRNHLRDPAEGYPSVIKPERT